VTSSPDEALPGGSAAAVDPAALLSGGRAVGTQVLEPPVPSTPAGAPARTRWWSAHPLALTVLAFLAIALVVWFVAYWSVLHPPAVRPVGTPPPGSADIPTWFRGWAQWDGGWYQQISREGYSYQVGVASSVAYFPVYPLLIRLFSLAAPGAPSPLVIGSLITLASGTASMALLWTWCRSRWSAARATTAVLLLAVFPYSIYLYGPVYADALFLAGALGSFVLLERNRILAATLVCAVTSGVRPAGFIIAAVLVLRLIEIRRGERESHDPDWSQRPWLLRWSPQVLHPKDWVILGSAGGFLAYCFYLASRFRDPLAFASTQASPGWDQPAGPHTWFKVALFEELAREPLGPAALGLLLQASVVLLVLVVAPFVGRRIGWAYTWLMVLLAAMVTLGSKDFQGAGRYLLPALVPVVALASGFLTRHRALRVVVVGAGFVLLCYFASWFAKGNYLA
jgi:hypothetical protein